MYKIILFSLLVLSCRESKNDISIPNVQTEKIETGVFIEKYSNGNIKIKGNLVKNIRQGVWESFYENGVKWSESKYLNGERNGISKALYSNGNIKIYGSYRKGKKVGVWFFYLENGKFEKEVNFDKKDN
jgi:antitoxin component YwqK of YwqJK toxin-antitoxin module